MNWNLLGAILTLAIAVLFDEDGILPDLFD